MTDAQLLAILAQARLHVEPSALGDLRRFKSALRVAICGRLGVRLSQWDESKHPRGQPANSGQFTMKHVALAKDIYFHGSDERITVWHVPEHGLSFTSDEYHAREFGKHIHKVKLHITNPLDLTSLGSGAGEEGMEKDERVSTKQIQALLADNGITIRFPRERKGWTTGILAPMMPEIIKQARQQGFDALQVLDFNNHEAIETVVFDAAQIEDTD